jgi:hypothetical protein
MEDTTLFLLHSILEGFAYSYLGLPESYTGRWECLKSSIGKSFPWAQRAEELLRFCFHTQKGKTIARFNTCAPLLALLSFLFGHLFIWFV